MVNIREIAPVEVPLDLLLLADPSAGHIARYLPECLALVAVMDEKIVGALLLRSRQDAGAEIMNLAVAPAHQRQRIGTALVESAAARARQMSAKRLCVGTGNSSLGELAFYQRTGFRIAGVTRDYFKDYDPPIFENGLRCLDMIHLVQTL